MLGTLGSLKMLPCLLGASIIYEFLQIPTDIFISCGCLFLIWLHWVWLSSPQKYQCYTNSWDYKTSILLLGAYFLLFLDVCLVFAFLVSKQIGKQ